MKKYVVVIIVLLVLCFTFYMKFDNKPEDKNIHENSSTGAKYETEKFYLENLSSDGYGFAKVYYDDHIDLVQLIKNGEDKKIMSFSDKWESNIWNELYHMQIVDNKFNFSIIYSIRKDDEWTKKNERVYSIDLNTLETKKVVDSKEFELTYDEYTLNDEYLFIPRTQDVNTENEYKIIRYDLKTMNSTVINDKLEADELFIYGSKLYLKCSDKYYYMDFDGNNIKTLNKNEYSKVISDAHICFERSNYLSKDTYFIKNNKKVYLEDNKLIYDNKVLYSSKKGRSMDLYYTDKIGYVAFADYEIKEMSEGDFHYYLVDLDTREIEEVNEDEIYGFYSVFY